MRAQRPTTARDWKVVIANYIRFTECDTLLPRARMRSRGKAMPVCPQKYIENASSGVTKAFTDVIVKEKSY